MTKIFRDPECGRIEPPRATLPIQACDDGEGDPSYRQAMCTGRRSRCNGNCYKGRACDCEPNVETKDDLIEDAAFMRRVDERVKAYLWVLAAIVVACGTPWVLHHAKLI